MLELAVAAFEDGWAFVQEGERFWLVRPPYRRDDLADVAPSAITRALGLPGFELVGAQFADWATLVAFLRRKLTEVAPVLPPAAGAAGAGLLEHAPPEILARYLDRIERELLPARRETAACNLLLAMLDLDIMQSERAMHRRATDLLRRATEAIATRAANRTGLIFDEETVERCFARAARAHGAAAMTELAKSIASQGQLMRLAA